MEQNVALKQYSLLQITYKVYIFLKNGLAYFKSVYFKYNWPSLLTKCTFLNRNGLAYLQIVHFLNRNGLAYLQSVHFLNRNGLAYL